MIALLLLLILIMMIMIMMIIIIMMIVMWQSTVCKVSVSVDGGGAACAVGWKLVQGI